MATRIEVLSAEIDKVVGTKGANKGVEFSIPKAQCIVHLDNGSRKVGVLNIAKDQPLPKPGMYQPVIDVAVGFDGKIVGVISSLVAVKA